MVFFGLDASHHQGELDFARFRSESGIRFAFLKATEGSTFVDSDFANNLVKARNAGMLVAAYHYVRSSASVLAQVANVRRVVPRDVPVIPDVEANSGGIQLTRDFINELRSVGYRVPLVYLPRWYWQQIGSPSLSGLPPLWSSRYPDNVAGSLTDEWVDVPASYWNGYGGLPVAVLQFTSSGNLPGYAGSLDLNAYPGTYDQLSVQLGYGSEDIVATANDVWSAQVWHHYPDTPEGHAEAELFGNQVGDLVEEHTAGEWLTAMAVRTSETKKALADMQAKLDQILAAVQTGGTT